MILNRGEAIMCGSREEGRELCEILIEEGYRFCDGEQIRSGCIENGVRWLPDCSFPSCVALVSDEIADELAQTGYITAKDFTSDHGHAFNVRWFGTSYAATSVEDLL